MKTFTSRLMLAVLLFTLAGTFAIAATPKDGRYKGTMTFRTVVEGNVKAEAKKVIPMAGVLTGGIMVVVMPEVPKVSGKFDSLTFDLSVADGSVQVRGFSGNYFNLSEVKTTATAIKGTTDFGAFSATGGAGFARYFIAVTLTRVGN
ncbi:MAG: hypothetical protein WCF18_01305 [Chthoniobacteraceae bacterium]